MSITPYKKKDLMQNETHKIPDRWKTSGQGKTEGPQKYTCSKIKFTKAARE